MIFYFSGCGNSHWVAKQIADATNAQLGFIPELQRNEFNKYTIEANESLGFVFPVYSWGCPQLVEDFIRNVKWNGTPSYCWMACTCGDEMGMTRPLFEKLLDSVGLKLNASYGFRMPNTYLAMKGFNIDSPELTQSKLNTAEAKMTSVIENIKQEKHIFDDIIGTLPRLKSYIIRPRFIKYVNDKKYFTTDACNGCGLCSKKCPLQNITIENNTPTWNGNCTQCMACYHYCPKNAIQFGTATQGKGQYTHKG